MVEGIERLDAVFDLHTLSEAEDLEETQVEVLYRIRAFGVATESRPTGLNQTRTSCSRNLNYVNVAGINATKRVRISQSRRARAHRNDSRTSRVRRRGVTHIWTIRGRNTIAITIETVDNRERRT